MLQLQRASSEFGGRVRQAVEGAPSRDALLSLLGEGDSLEVVPPEIQTLRFVLSRGAQPVLRPDRGPDVQAPALGVGAGTDPVVGWRSSAAAPVGRLEGHAPPE
jgi:hypothetical protein